MNVGDKVIIKDSGYSFNGEEAEVLNLEHGGQIRVRVPSEEWPNGSDEKGWIVGDWQCEAIP